jgi:hypothetical protein
MKRIHRTFLATATSIALLGGSLAVSAADLQLPPERHQGSVAYVSGGIGKDEATAFEQAAAQYPLTLEFVEKTSPHREFLSDVAVVIQDQRGQNVLSTRTTGPFLLVNLPDGRYQVITSYNGKREERRVTVNRTGRQRVIFEWNASST